MTSGFNSFHCTYHNGIPPHPYQSCIVWSSNGGYQQWWGFVQCTHYYCALLPMDTYEPQCNQWRCSEKLVDDWRPNTAKVRRSQISKLKCEWKIGWDHGTNVYDYFVFLPQCHCHLCSKGTFQHCLLWQLLPSLDRWSKMKLFLSCQSHKLKWCFWFASCMYIAASILCLWKRLNQ